MIELPVANQTGLFIGAHVRAFVLEPGDSLAMTTEGGTAHFLGGPPIRVSSGCKGGRSGEDNGRGDDRAGLRVSPAARHQRVRDALLTAREAVDEALRRLT